MRLRNVLGPALAGAGEAKPSVGRALLASTSGNLGLNVAAVLFNAAIALVLSNMLGTSGYGAYAFAVSWAMLLSVMGGLGLAPLLVREIATYRVHEKWAHLRGVLRRSNQAVAVSSVAVSTAALAVSLTTGWPDGELRQPARLGLLLVPLTGLVAVRQGALQGFGRVVLARTPETVVAPAFLLVSTALAYAILGPRFTATTAVLATIGSSLLAAMLGVFLLRRGMPQAARMSSPRYETPRWLRAASPLILFGAIAGINIQIGTVLVGSLAGASEAGVFAVANRAGGFVPFVALATMPALMPVLAELHATGERAGLQRVLSQSARLVLIATAPLAAVTLIFAEPLLTLFGGDFTDGATALRIIAVGHLANVTLGFPGTALVMTGNAGQLTASVAAGAFANVALTALLVGPWGAVGAATATAISIAGTNAILAIVLWRRHGLWSGAFGSRTSV